MGHGSWFAKKSGGLFGGEWGEGLSFEEREEEEEKEWGMEFYGNSRI